MRIQVKHTVPVWVVVDTDTQKVDEVYVDDEALERASGGYVDENGNELALDTATEDAVTTILNDPEIEWPGWNLGY